MSEGCIHRGTGIWANLSSRERRCKEEEWIEPGPETKEGEEEDGKDEFESNTI